VHRLLLLYVKPMKKVVWVVLASLLCAAAVVATFSVYQSSQAEENLAAICIVYDALIQFAEETRRLPSSWNELESRVDVSETALPRMAWEEAKRRTRVRFRPSSYPAEFSGQPEVVLANGPVFQGRGIEDRKARLQQLILKGNASGD
jgi:hypothetical protein